METSLLAILVETDVILSICLKSFKCQSKCPLGIYLLVQHGEYSDVLAVFGKLTYLKVFPMFVTQFARIDWIKGDVAVGKLQLSLFPQNIFVLAGVTVSLEQKHLREKYIYL